MTGRLPRNDIRQYDELADAWWDRNGPFAMLHWLAETRGALVPEADGANRNTPVLLDLACGAGLLAPHVEAKGYRHVGLDLTFTALLHARRNGVTVARGNVLELPFADDSADVVCAGEILEHVTNLAGAIAESCRVLKPGGTIVIDTLANTRLAKFVAVTIGERIHGGAPPGIHDPALFVDRRRLVDEYARHGVTLELQGIRPTAPSLVAWRLKRRPAAKLVKTRSTAVLFQAWGRKGV